MRERQGKVFDVKDHVGQIADVFSGMVGEYEGLIRGFHTIYLDDSRTDEYKRQQRASTANAIYDLVNGRVNSAKAVIESVKDEYRDTGNAPSMSADEKVFNLLYWKEVLPYADYNELHQHYTENKTDPVFKKLLFNEFSRREQEEPANYNMTEQQNLIAEVDSVMQFPELDKLETILHHVANTARETFNPGLESFIRTGQGSLNPRSISKDMDAFPIEGPGAGHRPLFSIPENQK